MSAARVPEENLNDDALESEIEMVSELVVAATSSDGPLQQDEVDLLLGVDAKADGRAGRSRPLGHGKTP
jgi:hypothetical protein